LEVMGCEVISVPTASYASPAHYCKRAKTIATDLWKEERDRRVSMGGGGDEDGGYVGVLFVEQFDCSSPLSLHSLEHEEEESFKKEEKLKWNSLTHYSKTAPEMWEQLETSMSDSSSSSKLLDAFVMSSGTVFLFKINSRFCFFFFCVLIGRNFEWNINLSQGEVYLNLIYQK